ncbi:MAG: hypothetical protein EXR79_08785 [Myxococcales bacterium]|nr:hypothetical protein [Myxococcales bacterium]
MTRRSFRQSNSLAVLVGFLGLAGFGAACANTDPTKPATTTLVPDAGGPTFDSGPKTDGAKTDGAKTDGATSDGVAADAGLKDTWAGCPPCDDSNPCTDDLCGVDGKCANQPNAADCDDKDPCTGGDKCAGGTCAPGKAKLCLDGGAADAGDTAPPKDAAADAAPPKGPNLKAGDLVVTEIMTNPFAAQDSVGEWFEIFNTTDAAIALEGLVVRDAKPDKYFVPASVTIAAKGYLVFGLEGDKAKNGGVPVDHVIKSFALFNSADQVILESNGITIDQVAYDIQKGWPDTNGVSLSLSPTATDFKANDVPANWCGATTALGPGLDKATPGQPNDACLPDGDKDGVPDAKDNCPTIANASQLDVNKNGVGDACEGASPNCGNKAVDAGEACDDGNKVSGDGCSVYCQVELPIVPGGLVIAEFMPNPAGVADDLGEWVELYNPTSADVALNGAVLQTGTVLPIVHVIESPQAIVVPANGWLLLANNADAATNGGLKPGYVYAKVALSSTAASLLVKSAGQVVDAVTYSPKWPIVAGKAVALDPGKHDAKSNDDPVAWCKATKPYGDKGDFGTPGAANGPCEEAGDEDGDTVPDKTDNCKADKNPQQEDGDKDGIGDVCDNCKEQANDNQQDSNQDGTGDACEKPGCGNGMADPGEACEDGNKKAGDGCGPTCKVEVAPQEGALVITELMANPKAVTDDLGEWIELFNASTVEVELVGVTLRVGTSAAKFDAAASAVLAPGGFAVLAKNGDKATNGGLDVALAWTGVALPNSGTVEVRIEAGAVVVDKVVYGAPGGVGAVGDGASLALAGTASATTTAANDVAANWCTGKDKFGGGDLGSPGKANPECAAAPLPSGLTPGDVIFTEIMPNGLGGVGDQGEWVEVKNMTAAPIDLAGVTLKNKTSSHVIKGPLAIAAGGYVALGANGDVAKNGGSAIAYVYGTAIVLGNSDGVLSLEVNGKVLDATSYTSAKPWPGIKQGVAMQLDPKKETATDNDKGESWCLATAKIGGGALLGTPGAANSACGPPLPPPPPPGALPGGGQRGGPPGSGKQGFGGWYAPWFGQ